MGAWRITPAITEQAQHVQQDHENATRLAQAPGGLPELEIDPNSVQTNMIFARVKKASLQELKQKMSDEDVLVHGSRDNLRLVTHLDFKQEHIERVKTAFR